MRALGMLVLLLAMGCRAGAPTVEAGDVRLETTLPSYGPGAEVTMRLVNGSGGQVGYNLCASLLERRVGSEWAEVGGIHDACTMELRILEPGGTAEHTFRLAAGTPGGQYRVVTTVERMGSGARAALPSDTFAVTPR